MSAWGLPLPPDLIPGRVVSLEAETNKLRAKLDDVAENESRQATTAAVKDEDDHAKEAVLVVLLDSIQKRLDGLEESCV